MDAFSGWVINYDMPAFPHRNTNFTMESFFQVVLWFSRGLSRTGCYKLPELAANIYVDAVDCQCQSYI